MAKKTKTTLSDFGEKIGGARKDMAIKKGPREPKGEVDSRPGWMRRFGISQIEKSYDPSQVGKFSIRDLRTKDWRGMPKEATRQVFASHAEAEAAIPLLAVSQKHVVRENYGKTPDGKYDTSKSTFEIWRRVSDKKAIKAVSQTFSSRDEATKYMAQNASTILGEAKGYGEEIKARPERVYRKGPETRAKDVNPKQFLNEFGVRGVEFGNWQDERQTVVNHAYDAMRDLSDVTGIHPESLTLEKRLALAFGARGHGGKAAALAHYEPAAKVINLTKLSGAGSLAHEWWHAADHFFGGMDRKPTEKLDPTESSAKTINQLTDGIWASHRTSGMYSSGSLNDHVRKAYTDLMDTMLHKSVERKVEVEPLEKRVAYSKKELQKQIEGVRNDLTSQKDPQYYKQKNAPATAEQLAEFDRHAAKLLAGAEKDTEHRWNDSTIKNMNRPAYSMRGMAGRWSNDAIDAISDIYKQVRGRSGFGSGDSHGPMNYIASSYGSMKGAQTTVEKARANPTETVRVATDYVKNASELDKTRTDSYWNTKHELSARAFESWVYDRLHESGRQSDYLVYGVENTHYKQLPQNMAPYPGGDERKAINAKFDALFKAVREQGIMKSLDGGPAVLPGAASNIEAAMKDAKSHSGWGDNARAASAEVRQEKAAEKAPEKLPTFAKEKPPQHILDRAAELGRAAFGDGKGSAPALSAELNQLMFKGEGQSFEKTAIMDAYSKAWMKANLDEPVPGVTDKETLAKNKADSEARLAKILNETKPASQWSDAEKYRQLPNGDKMVTEAFTKAMVKEASALPHSDPTRALKIEHAHIIAGTAWRPDGSAYVPALHKAAEEDLKKQQADAFAQTKRGKRADKAATKVAGDNGGPSETALKTAKKLEEIAKRTIERAEEVTSRDRKMNTARRIRMGNSVVGDAQQNIADAKTALKIAEALRNGEAGALANVKSLADIRELNRLARAAEHATDRKEGRGYKPGGYGLKPEDVANIGAAKGYLRVGQRDVQEFKEALHGKKGLANDFRTLERYAQGTSAGGRTSFETADPSVFKAMRNVANAIKKAETLKTQYPHQVKSLKYTANRHLDDIRDFDRQNRLAGGTQAAGRQQALKAFLDVRAGKTGLDPIKAAEQNLVGMKLPGFFPTPESLATRMADLADIKAGMRVLEPSAGTGRLADAAKAKGAIVDTVEMQSSLRDVLAKKGHNLVDHDFTTMDKPSQLYDRIVMNPPFEKGQDIAHVKRAYEMLKPGGRMVAVMGEGAFFRGDKQATEFRDWLSSVGTHEKLPDGTFKESNTGTNTRLVTIAKPGGEHHVWDDKARAASAEVRAANASPAKASSALERAMAASAERAKAAPTSTLVKAPPVMTPEKAMESFPSTPPKQAVSRDDFMKNALVKKHPDGGHLVKGPGMTDWLRTASTGSETAAKLIAFSKSAVNKAGAIALIGAPIAAAALAYDSTKSTASAAGRTKKEAALDATKAAVVTGVSTGVAGLAIAKGLQMAVRGAELAGPMLGKVAARAVPGLGIAAMSYGAYEGYKAHGIKGAVLGAVGMDQLLDLGKQAPMPTPAPRRSFSDANTTYRAMQSATTPGQHHVWDDKARAVSAAVRASNAKSR